MAQRDWLRPPFPYWGGKRRVAKAIWQRFGPVNSYLEPFAGSLAVMLACPFGPRSRELVNDIDGMVSNFWRSMRAAPEMVAYYADWPTSHLDLTARKQECVSRLPELERAAGRRYALLRPYAGRHLVLLR